MSNLSTTPLLGQFKEALSSDETASVFMEVFLGLNSDEIQMFLNHLVLKLQFEDLYLILQKVNHRIRGNVVLDSQDHDYSTDLAPVKEEAEESEEDEDNEEMGEHENIVIKVDPLCQAFESDSEDQKQVDLISFKDDLHLDYDDSSSCISASVQSVRLPCDECSETFCFFNELQEHKNKNHRFRLPCDECSETFGFFNKLQEHKNKNHRFVDNSEVEASLQGQYKCSLCLKACISKTFSSWPELEYHRHRVHKVHLKTDEQGEHFKCKKLTDDNMSDTPKKANGLTKPLTLSADLADLLGVDKDEKMSRALVVKGIWAYLKEHKLQDPQNKQWCNPDKKMEKIFGTEKFRAFGIAKYLKGHFS